MRDLESALRGAMAAEVDGMRVPADFAGQVRARHRRHRRIRLTATLAGLAAVVVAAPLATAAVLRDAVSAPPAEPAVEPAVDDVDGVELTYLPDGLRRDPVDGWDEGASFMAVTGRWRPVSAGPGGGYDRGLRVTVFRGPHVDYLPLLAEEVLAEGQERPEEQDGRIEIHSPDGQWRDVIWRADDQVSLRVRVSDDLAPELPSIIDGLRVAGPGTDLRMDPDDAAAPPAGGLCAPETNRSIPYGSVPEDLPEWQRFGGVSVSYVPDQVPASGVWRYQYHWGVDGSHGESVIIQVSCGDLVPREADGLADLVAGLYPDDAAVTEPYELPDGRPAVRVDRHLGGAVWPGSRVMWLAESGVAIEVSVADLVAESLPEIINGVTVASSGG